MSRVFANRGAARAAVGMLDAAFALMLAAAVLLALPRPALAYVDPSVMTYTIQALAGVAVALSTVAGVAYRRVRKHLVRKLGIDENAGKVVDPAVMRVQGEAELAQQNQAMAEFWAAAPDPGQAKALGFGGRLIRALVVCLFTFGTLLFLAPVELIAANASSLTYSLGNTWAPILVFALVVSVVAALVLSLLKGRVFDVVSGLVAAVGVCFWLQSLLLNVDMPSANGAPVGWAGYLPHMVLGTLAWAAVIGACVYCAVTRTKSFRPAMVGVCSLFLVVQVVGAGSIFLDGKTLDTTRSDDRVYSTMDGIDTLSPQDNIVVFVLDMFDTKGFMEMQDARPQATDCLKGFTFYPNSTGSFIPTHYALPYLMTATWPSVDEPFEEYANNRYERSTFLWDLRDAGYDLGLYTDTMGGPNESAKARELTINHHPLVKEDAVDVDWWGTATIMAKAAAYRDMPWILKPLFWYYTDDINIAMTPGGTTNLAAMPWVCNDARYHDVAMSKGLQVVDRGGKGSFRLIHLNGAHWPYTLTADGKQATGATDYNEQAEGALKVVGDYLEMMREKGLYDDATIIVTSDHGNWDWNHDDVQEATNPIMLVKPAQSAEKDAEPLKVSQQQTGHIDYHATIMTAATGKAGKYGAPVWDAPKEGRDRYFIYPVHDGKRDLQMVEYRISGNALDRNDWHEYKRWDYQNDGKGKKHG
ncbi:MAG: sulfatase-like hydrolase/transferase, partial [Coriobacteriia bacterium]|nr:sulfatase-like hydrolase/transferase [Coriobacteriia bacterium]